MTDPVARPPHDPRYGAPYPPADAPAELPPTRPFGTHQSPVYGSPAGEQAPSSAPPVSGQPSMYGSPAPPAPVYGTPAYGPPAAPPPAYGSSAAQSPVYGSAAPQSPVYGSPAPQSPPVYGSPAVSKAPVYGTPATDAPAYGARTSAPPSAYGAPQAYGAAAPGHGQVQPYDGGGPVQPYGAPATPAYHPAQPLHRLVPPGGRLGAVLLDAVLALVTLYIGWIIWALIVWSRGQTPGKQLLGHVVADANTGVPFTWGQMFMRDFVIRGLLFGVLNTVTFGIFAIVDACSVWGENNRTLHDRMAGSIVRYADV
jgi:uncharacterized RDD family membrane protein YckC